MDSLNYLKYDAEVFTPPFRLGRKQQRAVLDSLGKEVVIFPPNSAIQAALYVNYLNDETKSLTMRTENLEYVNGTLSIVRSNLMNEANYTCYCGNSYIEQKKKGCDMLRTKWIPELNQFRCPKCGWVSQYPKEFIDRYKAKWNK